MFIDEEIQKLGLLSSLPNQFTITNYSNRILKIEGDINLLSFTTVKILLEVSKHIISICGENLVLKDLTKSNITIVGEIEKIE